MAGFKGIVVLVVVASLAGASPVRDDDELKAVVVLFRHGDRTPLSSWPNDEYFENATLFPEGNGQLINLGKERHFELGQWFRERYDGFLPKKYHYSKIYVQSTDVDRTLQSAASNLAGLFPPEEEQVWNKNLLWQAIPIHTVPMEEDQILAAAVPCAKYDKLYADLMNSEQFTQWNTDLREVYLNLSQLTGYTVEEMDFNSFTVFFTNIDIYERMNFTLPSWSEQYWPLIKDWAARKFEWSTYTQELARLKTGPFFDYLFSYFTSVKENTLLPARNVRGPRHQLTAIPSNPAPRFLMLSAHDNTISDRANAMGVYPNAVPEFASTLIWELKQGRNGYYVNMYFKNSTGLSELTMPGCSFDCLLDEYQALLDPIVMNMDQRTKECNDV
ncbi:prostatic acid phosphatase-like isoform X2 [Euwallacea fornicatus]|uniref:prostatic acid phosphatase-like isoform X2 n=1 Tax=Euwallacea fornicatus TaxID=995702 RepID=UPI00338DACAD